MNWGGVILRWNVRNSNTTSFENQNGSSLTHYGVKGMRWGVRKEYELKGRKTKISGASGVKLTGGIGTDIGSIKDRAIRTAIGVVKIDGFDTEKKEFADLVIDTISKTYPDRYAPKEEAQKKLDEFEQNKYTMAYTRGNSQTYLVNHDGPSDIRLINCFECSIAYEMRNRGYNVQAKEMNGGWNAETMHAFDIKDAFDIQISLDQSYAGDKVAAAKEAYNQIAQQCLSFGDGARGCLGVQWAGYNSGHSMYWVVENGEFKIIDAQDSRRNGYEVFMSPAEAVDHDISVYRLDNADLLPGVTDFVEPYAPVTDEEKEKAKKTNKPTLNEVQARNKKEANKRRDEELKKAARQKATEEKEAAKSKVEKLLIKVKKTTKALVEKGKATITKLLKTPLIEKKTTTTRTTTMWKVR